MSKKKQPITLMALASSLGAWSQVIHAQKVIKNVATIKMTPNAKAKFVSQLLEAQKELKAYATILRQEVKKNDD